jgi:hypothetical protein
MIALTEESVTDFTGAVIEHAGQDGVMASQSFRARSASQPSHWHVSSATCNRSYMLAALRAGVIALVLLGILAVIVLF